MNLKKFIFNYKINFLKLLKDINFEKEIIKSVSLLKNCKKNKKKVIIFGNGASASIANHVSVDLTKNSKYRAVNFNESNLITCFSNDYGYKNWIKEALNFYYDKGDVVILVSSSGNSENIVKAAKWCKQKKIKLISLTGHKKNNALNKINQNGISFWINNMSYNYVETAHLFILLCLVDALVGKTVYKAK
tara:strand:- start:34602 stop:35171 length:570 start_codon:yes stop_codon:yes gene_type:complete